MAITTPFRKRQPTSVQEPEVQSYLANLWMQISILYLEIDFQHYFAKTSSTLVLFLNICYLTLKFYQRDIHQSSIKIKSKIILDDETSYFLYTLDFVELLFIFISITNAIILFCQVKRVVLFHHPTEPAFPDSEYCSDWDLSLKTRSAKMEIIESDESQPQQLKWVMRVWDPKDGNLRLFTWFSPPQVLMMYLSGTESCKFLILISYFTAGVIYVLIDSYKQLAVDYGILSGQLLIDGRGAGTPIKYSVFSRMQGDEEQ